MDSTFLEKVTITNLKRIRTQGGDVLKVLNLNENSFLTFGEAYFSEVKPGAIKAWKMHKQMTLNLVVPLGSVKFVFCEDNNGVIAFRDVIIGGDNYKRLTVKPRTWFGFMGLSETTSLVLNIANILHDPNEVEKKDIDFFNYEW